MDYSKYYTPAAIANLLISLLDIPEPNKAIDICCGSYNLLHAAKSRWSSLKLIGVDIIQHCSDDVECIQSDGRAFSVNHKQEYSLVLANPPFDSITEKKVYPILYDTFPDIPYIARLEIEMLLANLYLLTNDGVLLIILPCTFINGIRYKKIRKYIASNYSIISIIELPENTFGATRIKSHAIVLKNTKKQKLASSLFRIEENENRYVVVEKEKIIYDSILSGDWILPIKQRHQLENINIRRGTISSKYFEDSGIDVLHTAKNQFPWIPSRRFIHELPQNPVYVENGDIIISRIGCSAGQWCQYKGMNKILISDCLFSLKDKDKNFIKILNGKKYNGPIKGVATRYITKQDVINWIGSL